MLLSEEIRGQPVLDWASSTFGRLGECDSGLITQILEALCSDLSTAIRSQAEDRWSLTGPDVLWGLLWCDVASYQQGLLCAEKTCLLG